jgi:L-2,4-diaminobutyric acid acetyltransferase
MTAPTETLVFRAPGAADGQGIHGLIEACPPLDVNSVYAYHLIARHFASASAVAELDGVLVGVATGYRLPDQPETLFVWQVAVSEAGRGRGLAGRLLRDILARNPGLRFIHTTIGPGNAASRRVFAKLADELGAEHVYQPYLTAEACGPGHDPEDLLCIGPFSTDPNRKEQQA